MKKRTILKVIGALALGFTGCNYSGNVSGLHWFLDMHDSPAVKALREDPTTLDGPRTALHGADTMAALGGPGSGVRVPPEGTVPRGYAPYPYEQSEIDAAGRELVNPLRTTESVLARGKMEYDIYCAVCHGMSGKADGPVVPRFQGIFALVKIPGHAGASVDWSDGKIFHMITVGRGLMKPYAAQISAQDRWAIVHYVRLLQKAAKSETGK